MENVRKTAPRQTAAQMRDQIREQDTRILDLEQTLEACSRTNTALERDLGIAKHRQRELIKDGEQMADLIRRTAAKHVIQVGVGGSGVACRECGMLAPCSTRRDLLGDKANEGLRVDDYRHQA